MMTVDILDLAVGSLQKRGDWDYPNFRNAPDQVSFNLKLSHS